MKITLISDTHTLHKNITPDLIGGDILIHAGDIMNSGHRVQEVGEFCEWFDSIDNYKTKIFIAGNHDRMFQYSSELVMDIIDSYKSITYLQDSFVIVDGLKIYGSPWQPEFFNWAFNLPRDGEELKAKWDLIPSDVDILITHGPAYGFVDQVKGKEEHLGCKLLSKRIEEVKPRIHVCGHIHSGNGITLTNDTSYFNASVLDERYYYAHKPLDISL
jgi:Icc-related predicted phosphoesterase